MSKKVLFVSIFDHWLSEQEADECSVLCYKIASDCNDLTAYLKTEQYFLNFYQGLDSVVHVMDDGVRVLDTQDIEFVDILKNGLREIRFFELYFPTLGIVAQSGYDRTDKLIIDEKVDLSLIKEKISLHNLYVLDEVVYDEWANDDF